MDSTGFDAEMFIEAVKNCPVIWNTSLPEYHDKIKKRNAWKEVCSLMCNGFEEKSEKEQNDIGTKLVKKWKGMRDTFLKSMKKKTVSGQGATNRTYIYARQMDFLLHCSIPSATATYVDEDADTQIDEDGDDSVEDRNVAESAEPLAGPSSRRSPPLSATHDATAAKNAPAKRKHTGSEFSKMPAAKRRVKVEENLLKFINFTPAETPVEPINDDRSFFDLLLPLVKLDTKLEFRCSIMNTLRELRKSVNGAPNVPISNVLIPFQQQNMFEPPQQTHAPTYTPANPNEPLFFLSSRQQQIMHTTPQMLQHHSYNNLSPVSQDTHMSQSYPWVPSPSHSNSQHSSYTSPIHNNVIE